MKVCYVPNWIEVRYEMIEIIVKEEMYIYDMYHIVKAFFPGSEIHQTIDGNALELIELRMNEQQQICFWISTSEVKEYTERKQKKRYVNLKVYDRLSKQTGKELAWGVLTGIRPTKIMMNLLEEGKSEQEVIDYMKEKYRTIDKKARLGMEIAMREKALLEQLDYKDGYSLYVGIPFCPTTCSYCSFTSQPIHKWKDRVDEYLDALCKEISFVGEVSKEKKLNTVYIGGGTPTTLEPKQLERLLSHIEKTCSFEYLKEFTVEAGRPDSITKEKLDVLKRHQISRISINPQTMQQKTLDCIGRKHTVEDTRRVYAMAREVGFENINMDLIAGLPGETLEDMRHTLQQIEEFAPDSLTVHALAMKRASRLTQEKREGGYQGNDQAGSAQMLSGMIELAAEYAGKMHLVPYYLYRQKNIAGNFENVGYAKVDKAGIYNILIMEEKQSIVACGAGASTKLVLPKEKALIDEKTGNPKQIVRTENVKDVEQYINRIGEMIERKGEWLWH